jgi:hypothetical protein
MARRSTRNRPETATVLRTFAALREVLKAFARGSFSLLVIMGRPGLTKSRHVRKAIEGSGAGYVKGYHTKLDYYGLLYQHQDKPIVLDDANRLLENKDTREMTRDMTETDTYKKLEYGSTSSILEKNDLPKFFYTKSPVCFVTNYWDSSDPVFQALESRAEFFVVEVTWEELHRDAAGWFWDQAIFDHVQDRLHLLREPDARLYVKAWERKKSGLQLTPWTKLIDDYCDDRHGLIIRQLLAEDHPSDNVRFAAYLKEVEKLGTTVSVRPLARSNFYARCKKIRLYAPTSRLPRIPLKRTKPPEVVRPADGALPGKGGPEGEE